MVAQLQGLSATVNVTRIGGVGAILQNLYVEMSNSPNSGESLVTALATGLLG